MTTLYRLYDNAGELLYIGIAEHWPSRMQQHAREKAWWADVAATKLEHFPDRDVALDAERDAIRSERPIHNVHHASNQGIAPWAPKVCGRIVTCGTVAAFGLANGKCPIGRVIDVRRQSLDLDLFSFATGTFGYDTRIVRYADVRAVKIARRMSRQQRKRHYGVWSLTGPAPWDIDPLADFQSDWVPA